MESNEIEDPPYQNMQAIAKTVFKGKREALNAYIRKEEEFHINNLPC